MAEDRQLVFEVHTDAAEKHAAPADVRLVGPRWRVQRHQDDVVTAAHELRRQRVVAQATAAVHRARRRRSEPGASYPLIQPRMATDFTDYTDRGPQIHANSVQSRMDSQLCNI
jgi:hypothetical protein